MSDTQFMHHALALAQRGLGVTSPNPSVGCVIVKDGIVIGRGVTAKGGRPHAERLALAQAGSAAKGADVYVTLEPCAHHGVTSPCSQALIDAGVKRVICAAKDPDPRVAGSGFAMLEAAGIHVDFLYFSQAEHILKGHFCRILAKRPMVQLKLALSKDGFIAPLSRERTQISGEMAGRYVHLLRAQCDALLVGAGTFKADKPLLTCRLQGMEARTPLQIILGTILGTSGKGQETPQRIFRQDIPQLLQELYEKGHSRLMVEGGAAVAQSFLDQRLVDELVLITSKTVQFGAGLRVSLPLQHFKLYETLDLHDDIAQRYSHEMDL
jgi:diaminohydroxyphosphoribosylaminopyrimidine deaminase / 5-amino-6-(5-phosphoribosylamino)uracil reductase